MAEDYKVNQGDCIGSIAYDHGFFWETLWNDSGNADLKQRRKDPNVLAEGDVVHIPDATLKEESCATEARHRFKLKGVPAKVRIKVLREDQPRAREPYRLTIDGKAETGTTDADGIVEMTIPPNARQGELRVGKAGAEEIYHFQLGAVDPLSTEAGVRGRMRDLGYDDSLPFEELLAEFQRSEGITPISGSLDQATESKLRDKFGQ